MVAPDIAIIGAGLAGLACARGLADRGLRATVIDKGRAPGGRTSTRQARFDHGAARLELGAFELAEVRASWEAAGVIAPWVPVVRGGTPPPTWIGVPGANALAGYLARDLDVRVAHRVVRLAADGAAWRLELDGDVTLGPFATVVLTPPAPQTRELLATAGVHDPALDVVAFAPCLAAMAIVRTATQIDELHVGDGPLAQAHRMDRRPGRLATDGAQHWVLHGRDAWSAENLEEDPDASAAVLAETFARELPCDVVEVVGHRWRHARATRRIAAPFLVDVARGLACAGDWFDAGAPTPAASRALLSGFRLAKALHAR